MDEKKKTIADLYNKLEQLQYPEIAQTQLKDFEDKILTGNKRTELLVWLLEKCSKFSGQQFDNLQDEQKLEDMLFKCYSQFGFCDEKYKLIGKCAIDQNISFLKFLNLFISSIHLTNDEVIENKKDDTFRSDSIKSHDSKESQLLFKENEKSIKESKTENEIRSSCFNKFSLLIEESYNESCKENILMQDDISKDFKSAFTNFASIEESNYNDNQKELAVCIKNLQSKFSAVNKIQSNDEMLKNQKIPNDIYSSDRELTQIIQNCLVLIEQSCNTLMEN